ncbi:MAG: hypothetical protein KKA07_09245 [Bacteroidetes bacterium]|nr:hypothetical protein [Bacteroidota bacterium]MBU1719246.1 hypothetical protein [Bacteroidota bacterium]
MNKRQNITKPKENKKQRCACDLRIIAPLQGVGVFALGNATCSGIPDSRVIVRRGEIGVFALGNATCSETPDSPIIARRSEIGVFAAENKQRSGIDAGVLAFRKNQTSKRGVGINHPPTTPSNIFIINFYRPI